MTVRKNDDLVFLVKESARSLVKLINIDRLSASQYKNVLISKVGW